MDWTLKELKKKINKSKAKKETNFSWKELILVELHLLLKFEIKKRG